MDLFSNLFVVAATSSATDANASTECTSCPDEAPSEAVGPRSLGDVARILRGPPRDAVAFVVSALASPFLVCAVAVKLTSKGPIFFEQERMGENGETFSLYKLRTMPVDAEKDTGPVLPKRDDRRATPLGRVLRRLSLDELPQLWNVIKGDMSLVGPRPERPVFVEKFKEDIPRYMSRHLVKSGVTGWAQVNGLRGDTSIKIRVEYDMFYLENWSLFFDIKILLLTIFSRRVHQLTQNIPILE